MSVSRSPVISDIWKEGYRRLALRIASLLPCDPDSYVLELGSGWGQLTAPLSKAFPGRILAVDASKDNITSLKAMGLGENVSAQASDLSGLGLDGESFDGVVSNFMLGWLDQGEMRKMIELCKKVLKPGGIMVHSDFNPQAADKGSAPVILQSLAENNLDPSVRWWTPEEVAALAKRMGFAHVSITGFDWQIQFDYPSAMEQLRRWGAKPEFILLLEEELMERGMSLPKSFIMQACKREGVEQ